MDVNPSLLLHITSIHWNWFGFWYKHIEQKKVIHYNVELIIKGTKNKNEILYLIYIALFSFWLGETYPVCYSFSHFSNLFQMHHTSQTLSSINPTSPSLIFIQKRHTEDDDHVIVFIMWFNCHQSYTEIQLNSLLFKIQRMSFFELSEKMRAQYRYRYYVHFEYIHHTNVCWWTLMHCMIDSVLN